MSFSFYVKAKGRVEAFREASKQLEGVARQQPAHEKDVGHITETIGQYLFGLVSKPGDDEYLGVSVAGSIATVGDDVRGANISISITILADTGS
jgi:hypothetical protein